MRETFILRDENSQKEVESTIVSRIFSLDGSSIEVQGHEIYSKTHLGLIAACAPISCLLV